METQRSGPSRGQQSVPLQAAGLTVRQKQTGPSAAAAAGVQSHQTLRSSAQLPVPLTIASLPSAPGASRAVPGDHQRGQERGPCPGRHAGTLGTVPPATEQSLGWKILQHRWPQAGPQMPGVATPSRRPCFPRESRTPSMHTAGEMGLLFISVHSWVTRSQSREKLAPGGPLTITRGHQGPRADRGTCRARARPPPRR